MFTDLPEADLWRHRSGQTEPDDFDAFWQETLAEARSCGGEVVVEPVRTGLSTVDTFDVTFPGFGGEPVRAWLRLPRTATGPLPVVVHYVGYGGGRGHVLENLLWASAGYAHLQMDTRGQGSGWSRGATPDSGPAGPQAPGVMTRGIDSPHAYYYRRLFTDAVRAVDAARRLDRVAPGRVAVVGQSQGGGVALAVAALVPDVAALVAHVPFLCDFPRAVTVTDSLPFREIADYLAIHRDQEDRVMRTLSYVDGVNFARRAAAPARFSAALMDAVVPPSTVFAAYHAYAGPKAIAVWRYNGHEAGGPDDDQGALDFLTERLGPADSARHTRTQIGQV
ncbi:acetylxylan esterase [Streptacidiphilus jiangxiensis]|uniref:Cephalosporin-C deacetylase n=1 Tax=Streptacidiphilus jiangxiensis TaxID=235985 RepID=A0A1H8AUT0_STRJI|nr:acetylxylan esterase [Streptacidiphilus jiangxiensis]SEM74571.1 cephalosporin-C deacetylase [Streptacidiphilus jiangxiensis]